MNMNALGPGSLVGEGRRSTSPNTGARMRQATRLVTLIVNLLMPLLGAAQEPKSDVAPYQQLQRAYAGRNAEQAADAYSENAVYSELYDGAAPRLLIGRKDLRDNFVQLFDQIAPSTDPAPDLNFRLVERRSVGATSSDVGIYRLRFGPAGARQTMFGRFATQAEGGKFTADVSTGATEADFEDAAGTLLFSEEDEQLSSSYYDMFLGDYRGADGCVI